ncbi:MAG: iron-containing alcohol dehydrogenase [Opitutaceae bacterium]|nr:iron-containing alcohol dehydrogenase [Opitutaceae bacterium]
MPIHSFSFPTQIHFGANARSLIPDHLAQAGVGRPLIVTDRGLAALPLVAELQSALAAAGLSPEVYSGVHGNPTASQATAGTAAFRAHRADAIIGLGGGAALDVAKAVALLTSHDGDILEYAWDHPKVRAVVHPLPYLVAVPTTSGTGSEVGRSAVISEESTHIKRIIFSPRLLARAVFADPELTLSLPAHLTAATGMDALTHNIESYLSPVYHPLCDGIALEGARLAARSLVAAVRDGRNLRARSDLMMSSLLGGIAFQKDLGAVHSCAHALSAVCDLHHGLANGLMLDHVMRFNAPSAPEKIAELARVCQEGAAPQSFPDWVASLKTTIGIPARLDAVGVTATHLPRLVDIALADPCHKTNPRPCTRADLKSLFAAAL